MSSTPKIVHPEIKSCPTLRAAATSAAINLASARTQTRANKAAQERLQSQATLDPQLNQAIKMGLQAVADPQAPDPEELCAAMEPRWFQLASACISADCELWDSSRECCGLERS